MHSSGGRGGGGGGGVHCPGCAWCAGDDEELGAKARARCASFRRLKQGLSPWPYLGLALRPAEEAGFASAGVLAFRRHPGGAADLLLAHEHRQGQDRLNFLGGKRRTRGRSAASVALAKLDLETGGCLRRRTLAAAARAAGLPLVHWNASAKYALFLLELRDGGDRDVDVAAFGVEGAKRLEWVPRDALRSDEFARAELHFFAAAMLAEVRACAVLDAPERLFDAAAAAVLTELGAQRTPPPPPPPPPTPAAAAAGAVGGGGAGDDLAALLRRVRLSAGGRGGARE